LGFKTRLLYQAGPTGEQLPAIPDEEIDRVVGEIQSSSSNSVILVVLGNKIMVLPYREK
jgi:hypothetical protein